MADKYYMNFVGLNGIIYEPCQFSDEQLGYLVTKPDSEYLPLPGSKDDRQYVLIGPNRWDAVPDRSRVEGGLTVFQEPHYLLSAPTNFVGAYQVRDRADLFGASSFAPAGGLSNITDRSSTSYMVGYVGTKNFAWTHHELPNTASYFPALMLYRNGPYGWPSWKTIRVGESKLFRRQRKDNIFSYVHEPGEEVIINGVRRRRKYRIKREPRVALSPTFRVRDSYNSMVWRYFETPVAFSNHPMTIKGATVSAKSKVGSQLLDHFKIDFSYTNNVTYFNNDIINKYYGYTLVKDEAYENIKDLYLDDSLDSPESPFDGVEYIKYKESIYPKEEFLNRPFTRGRRNFEHQWNNKRPTRTATAESYPDTSGHQGAGTFHNDSADNFSSMRNKSAYPYSVWPLDVNSAFITSSKGWQEHGFSRVHAAYILNGQLDDYGILQNVYTTGYGIGGYNGSNLHDDIKVFDSDSNARARIRGALGPGPLYNRKHMLSAATSSVGPNCMRIEGVNWTGVNGTTTLFGPQCKDFNRNTWAGEAAWDAPAQANKYPFADSYNVFSEGVRQLGKGYTILPEFKISDHIPAFATTGSAIVKSKMLTLEGSGRAVDSGFGGFHTQYLQSVVAIDDSDDDDFYKVYSTSDFLKNFDVVMSDHDDFLEPSKIKLTCKVIKKFIPYKGFYPAERSVDIARQFHESYSGSVSSRIGEGIGFQTGQDADNIDHGFQNVMGPLFGPGVFFNTIKSGVACDYPILTSSVSERVFDGSGNNLFISASVGARIPGNEYEHDYFLVTGSHGRMFDKRIPFNALLEPERYLSNYTLACMEPHIYANVSSSAIWDGSGNNLYKMMVHNFLAEVPSFFLSDQNFTTIASKKSNDPTVGNVSKGTTYAMRVTMYKSMSGSSKPNARGSGLPLGLREVVKTPNNRSDDGFENFTMYSRPSAFGPPQMLDVHHGSTRFCPQDPLKGENYSFTPPYYYGAAFADIHFQTSTTSRKFDLNEIVSQVHNVKYYRYIDDEYVATNTDGPSKATDLLNDTALQLSASLNLFALGEIKSVDLLDDDTTNRVKVAVDISSDESAQWIIQPFFETPMLNFNKYQQSSDITMPVNGSGSVPRGMWHQYGIIDEDPSTGVFMQVSDIPNSWLNGVSGSNQYESLADLCGFNTDPVRLGQIADAKVIREAIVAIPFVTENSEKKFFRIPRSTIELVKKGNVTRDDYVSPTIVSMVEKMQRYVFPPSFDFLHRGDVDPFAMYIFEFKHVLDRQDLADIWQNLPPKIGEKFEVEEASIEHDLLAHELLGGGDIVKDRKVYKGNKFNDKIQWLVFKVKQRAQTNYYNKVIGELGKTQQTIESTGLFKPIKSETDISFNWPYDFFSLIELGKLETEITLSNLDLTGIDERPTVAKLGKKAIASLRQEPLAELPSEVKPPSIPEVPQAFMQQPLEVPAMGGLSEGGGGGDQTSSGDLTGGSSGGSGGPYGNLSD